MKIGRRALTGVAAAILGAPAALAGTSRTTYIYSPHPDDETLYLAAYITFAVDRGDRLVLVAVTDGGATFARAKGWSQEDIRTIRRIEQEAAWRALTGGRGGVVRLGLEDGAGASLTAPVREYARSVEGPHVEHYVAANDNESVDHASVVRGIRDAGVRVARFSNRPGSSTGYRYRPADVNAARVAAGCYVAVGQRSVPSMFKDLEQSGYSSRIVG